MGMEITVGGDFEMKRNRASAIVVGFLCGMVAGVLVGRGLFSTRQQAAVPPVPVEGKQTAVEPAKDDGDSAVAALNQEKAQLQAEIDGLWRQLKEAKDQLLRALLKEQLAEMAKESSEQDAATVWTSGLARFQAAQSAGGWFPGLEERLQLLVDFGRLGEPGVDVLLEVISDTESSEDEKDTAGEMLVFLPHKKALEALLANEYIAEYFDPGERLPRVAYQLARLPAKDVLPYAAEVRQLAEDNPSEPAAEEVLALLAEMGL